MSDIKIVAESQSMNFAIFGLSVGDFYLEREKRKKGFGA
jgi:hypothetical protein